MAIGLPVKANYAAGDILTATNMNDLSGTLNQVATDIGYGQAGKNKIINGDMGVWQRGTSFSNPASGAYLADRWGIFYNGSGGTRTYSQQTFTPGTAPVAGYEGSYFLRYARTVAGTSATVDRITQKIEDVRTFAGQTATLSFWAKADSGTPSLTTRLSQNFGSGGSVEVNLDVSVTLSTTWTRYTATFSLASITGKTIGTNSYLELQLRTPVNTIQTFDFWGVQVEYGSKATAFQTATGTIQGELAACQRYYFQTDSISDNTFSPAITATTGVLGAYFTYPVQMRIAPTIVTYDTAGASGNVTRGTYGSGIVQNGQASTVFQTNKNGTNIYSSSGNSHTFIRFGYSAAAEL
jgi:hypothetical protein